MTDRSAPQKMPVSYAASLAITHTARKTANGGQETSPMLDPHFERFVGSWAGKCTTWFSPGEVGDESHVAGEFRPILGGRFLRHSYAGEMQGRPRAGEETIGFNSVTNKFQTAWVDDFHMSNGIMFSEGPGTDTGFAVTGAYDVEQGSSPWGWRTVFEFVDDGHLTIVAFNITPDGQEAKAVQTEYARSASPA